MAAMALTYLVDVRFDHFDVLFNLGKLLNYEGLIMIILQSL